jgi:hypothetical protein
LPEGDPKAKPGQGESPKSEPEGKNGPIVEITSITQIEEKLGKQQVLSVEEAAALLDAMNKLIDPDDKNAPSAGVKKTSWVEWAKFIKENQDKLSGKTKTGEKGISPEDVNAVLAKYKEYVGVRATPTMTIEEKIRQRTTTPKSGSRGTASRAGNASSGTNTGRNMAAPQNLTARTGASPASRPSRPDRGLPLAVDKSDDSACDNEVRFGHQTGCPVGRLAAGGGEWVVHSLAVHSMSHKAPLEESPRQRRPAPLRRRRIGCRICCGLSAIRL